MENVLINIDVSKVIFFISVLFCIVGLYKAFPVQKNYPNFWRWMGLVTVGNIGLIVINFFY